MLDHKNIEAQDPEIMRIIAREEKRQSEELEMIASENYVSKAVLEAMGTILTNKYSEGYPGKRYYGGNHIVDEIENIAIERAKTLFGAEHVNVQPLSGSPANASVYLAFLQPGDTVMGLKLDHGGHLSHGHPVNFSGMLYKFVQYEVDPDTGRIDMDKVAEIARREKPKMIVAGFSAYSREVEWDKFKKIADEIGAFTFADIAHTAGLIAGGKLDNPVPIFDVVTTTTHKTLRGPRGAIIMCRQEYAQKVDRAVFPGMQGGPHDHITAAKAVAFGEALKPEFKEYAGLVIENAQSMAAAFIEMGYRVISGGTDNHLFVIDMTSKGLRGKDTEIILEKVGVSVSRSTIPNDPNPPLNPSGVRFGTAALTTRGIRGKDIGRIARWIDSAIVHRDEPELLDMIRNEIKELCIAFPIPTA